MHIAPFIFHFEKKPCQNGVVAFPRMRYVKNSYLSKPFTVLRFVEQNNLLQVQAHHLAYLSKIRKCTST
jgi:hypothetical protein